MIGYYLDRHAPARALAAARIAAATYGRDPTIYVTGSVAAFAVGDSRAADSLLAMLEGLCHRCGGGYPRGAAPARAPRGAAAGGSPPPPPPARSRWPAPPGTPRRPMRSSPAARSVRERGRRGRSARCGRPPGGDRGRRRGPRRGGAHTQPRPRRGVLRRRGVRRDRLGPRPRARIRIREPPRRAGRDPLPAALLRRPRAVVRILVAGGGCPGRQAPEPRVRCRGGRPDTVARH